MLTDIHGKPYTTATEDTRLLELKKHFQDVLGKEIVAAMQRSKDGQLNIDARVFHAFIDQAYYMGREDAS